MTMLLKFLNFGWDFLMSDKCKITLELERVISEKPHHREHFCPTNVR